MNFKNATLRIQPLLLSMDRETTFPFRIVEATIVLSISAAAICGNSLVAASAVRFQRWNNSINVYIVTLSIVGGIYGTILPFIVPNIIQHRNVFDESVCHIWGFVLCSCGLAATFTLTAIAFNRYYLIAHPHSYAQHFTHRVSITISTCLLLVAMAVVGVNGISFNINTDACSITPIKHWPYKLFTLILGGVVPFTLMSVFYIRLYCIVCGSKNRLRPNSGRIVISTVTNIDVPFYNTPSTNPADDPGNSSNREDAVIATVSKVTTKLSAVVTMSTDTTVTSKQSSLEEEIENNTTMAPDVVDRSESPIGKTRIRIPGKGKFSHAAKNSNSDNAPPTRQDIALTKVMLAIFIGFTFCFGPYFFVNVFDGETSRYPVFVYKMAAWMLYLQSCLNPIIYGFMNKQFRDDTKSMLRCG